MTQPQGNLTEQEVKDFAQKLEQWGQQLPPKERALLAMLIARAENAEGADVEGYSMPSISGSVGNVFSPQLAPLGGFGWVDVVAEWYKAPRALVS